MADVGLKQLSVIDFGSKYKGHRLGSIIDHAFNDSVRVGFDKSDKLLLSFNAVHSWLSFVNSNYPGRINREVFVEWNLRCRASQNRYVRNCELALPALKKEDIAAAKEKAIGIINDTSLSTVASDTGVSALTYNDGPFGPATVGSIDSSKIRMENTKMVQKTGIVATAANIASTAVDANKAALIGAIKLEVGSIALNVASAKIREMLPANLQALTDNPLGDILVANLVSAALRQFAPDNTKAVAVADAMLTVSMFKALENFDISSIVTGFLGELPGSKLDKLVDASTSVAAA